MAKEKLKKETKKVKSVKKTKKSFAKQVKEELKKVKWPTKTEMVKYSIASLTFIILFGLFFYGIDNLFVWIYNLINGLGA